MNLLVFPIIIIIEGRANPKIGTDGSFRSDLKHKIKIGSESRHRRNAGISVGPTTSSNDRRRSRFRSWRWPAIPWPPRAVPEKGQATTWMIDLNMIYWLTSMPEARWRSARASIQLLLRQPGFIACKIDFAFCWFGCIRNMVVERYYRNQALSTYFFVRMLLVFVSIIYSFCFQINKIYQV